MEKFDLTEYKLLQEWFVIDCPYVFLENVIDLYFPELYKYDVKNLRLFLTFKTNRFLKFVRLPKKYYTRYYVNLDMKDEKRPLSRSITVPEKELLKQWLKQNKKLFK